MSSSSVCCFGFVLPGTFSPYLRTNPAVKRSTRRAAESLQARLVYSNEKGNHAIPGGAIRCLVGNRDFDQGKDRAPGLVARIARSGGGVKALGGRGKPLRGPLSGRRALSPPRRIQSRTCRGRSRSPPCGRP